MSLPKEGTHLSTHNFAMTMCFLFCMAQNREKQQKILELLIYFVTGFKISAACVCADSLSTSLVILNFVILYHDMN